MAPGVEAPLHLLMPTEAALEHTGSWKARSRRGLASGRSQPFFAPEARSTVSATM
jgi:hypothetical protein